MKAEIFGKPSGLDFLVHAKLNSWEASDLREKSPYIPNLVATSDKDSSSILLMGLPKGRRLRYR
jgi:hypothetical protein